MWKKIHNRVQQESELIAVSHMAPIVHCVFPGNQEADALTKIQTICLQVPLEAAAWVHVKSGHMGANRGWKRAKAAIIPIKYAGMLYDVQVCEICSITA